MKRKIIALFLMILLAGCADRIRLLPSDRDFSSTPTQTQNEKTKTAVLLPLSGPNAAVGENFQNAVLMAGLDRPTESTEVLFYDTQGTPEGAVAAYNQALNESPDVFIGPVFAPQVRAVRNLTPAKPVLSFTSDESVIGGGVYTIALLIEQQIDRIVSYACAQGQRRFALIGPDDQIGRVVVKSFEKALPSCPGMEIVHQSLYSPTTTDLTSPVVRIAPPLIDGRRKDLTAREKELLKNPSAERLSFDALFVFEQGIKLEQLVSILYYYDVTPNIVPYYGLATLRQTKIAQLVGAYFADMPQERLNAFKAKYKEAFDKQPLPIATFGYDAASLVSFLSGLGALREGALTDSLGYQGINGRFRLNEDGTNARLLEIFKLRAIGYATVEEGAPAGF